MSNLQEKIEIISKHVGAYPDFPIPGVLFRDIFEVLKKPEIFTILNDVLVEIVSDMNPPVECVVGLDARGFLFGTIIALKFNIPFVPIRKKGKLPGKVASTSYSLEYGEATVEIQKDSIKSGQRVLIIDDLLATGGTLKAACKLIEQIGGVVSKCLVIMELEDLKGREGISADIQSLIKY